MPPHSSLPVPIPIKLKNIVAIRFEISQRHMSTSGWRLKNHTLNLCWA